MSHSSSSKLGHRIIGAGLAVCVAHGLFKLAGLLQVMVLGRLVPQGTMDVVYVAAFEGFIFNVFLIGEEVIGPAFLPVFMREMDDHGESSAWRFGNTVLTLHLLLLLGVVLGIMLFPGPIISLVTAWSENAHAAKFHTARTTLMWLAPSLIFFSLGSTTYMILNGYKRFFLAAFGDAAWKFCVLLFVLIGIGLFGFDYRCLVFGLLAGSMAKLLTHLVGMKGQLRLIRPRLDLKNPALKALLILMLPLIGGILFAKARDLYNHVTILSYLEADGLMTANSFGRKLQSAIGFLIPYALSIAMFPFLCELVDRRDTKQFGEVLSSAGRLLLAIFIPVALVCVVLARPLTGLLFEGGEFGSLMVDRTALSTACYTLVLPAAALEYLLMQAFFARRRMVAITLIGIVFSALSIAISYTGIRVLGATGLTALAVVALGFVLSRTLKVMVMIVLLKRQIPLFPLLPTAGLLLRTLLVGGLSAAAAWLTLHGIQQLTWNGSHLVFKLVELSLAGTSAAVGFIVGSAFFRLREPLEIYRWGLARVRGRMTGHPVKGDATHE